MYVYEEGEGEAVVLLHGANPPSHFDELARALSREHRVLVPHMPGWGESPALREGQGFDRTNRLLEERLLEMGVSRAPIVGYSLGGWRALELALAGELEIPTVYLLSTFTASPTPELRERYIEYAEISRSGPGLREAARDLYLPPEYAAAHPGIQEEVADWVDAMHEGLFAQELEAVAELEDLSPRLPRLGATVVARVGALDIAAPAEWSKAIVDAVPRGRLEIVEGCAHVLLYEDREATFASIGQAIGS